MAKELSLGEFRRTIATSLATAFAFVIGTIWVQVVTSAFGIAGISLTAGTNVTLLSWATFVITAVAITFVCVLAIVLIGRWAGREKQAS